ncbi:MAG: tetratricopeptide repeat protein [Planctomycetales bacterium]
MNCPRRVVLLACLVLSLAIGGTASAQGDDFSPFGSPTRSNPEADQARSAAEQAYHQGNYQQVVELANRLLANFPKDNPHVGFHLRASAQVELGRLARSGKQIRAGIADAQQAIAVAGKKYEWLYIPYLYGLTSLAEVEQRPDHAKMAIDVVSPVLQRPVDAEFSAEDKANLHYQRGLAHGARQDLKLALVDFEEALQLSPEHLGSHLRRADTLARQGRTQDAASAYDEAVRRFPKAVVVQNDRGNFRRTTGDLEGAAADFTRALELEPKFVVGYLNRGLCLADQNEPQAAQADFTSALGMPIDPGLKLLALRLRGQAQAAQGELSGALADYAAALQIAPQDGSLYEERGVLHFFKKDMAASAGDFAKALQLNPRLTRLTPWQAAALTRHGQTAQARQALAATQESKFPPNAWVVKLDGFLADQVSDEELLAAAQDLPPESGRAQRACEAHFFIGQKKLIAGDEEGATRQFRQALATGAFMLPAFRGARFELHDF